MGQARLPRDPDAQRTWARCLTAGRSTPPYPVLRGHRQSAGQTYRHLYWTAFEDGAVAALEAILAELDRPDDSTAGLSLHTKEVQNKIRATLRRRAREAAQKEQAA